MGILYVVATPIGNLKDISFRALEALEEADFILCEDTRITARLLESYDIKKTTLSYHQHSETKKTEHILKLLKEGKKLALVSDAGTPGISDPGGKLVAEVCNSDIARVIPIPGSSALAALASVSGFSVGKFVFLGFPPAKKKRSKFFEELFFLAGKGYPVIFYESPHRILKTLKLLQGLELVVGRELTKKFETIYRGGALEVLERIQKDKVAGEFAIIARKR